MSGPPNRDAAAAEKEAPVVPFSFPVRPTSRYPQKGQSAIHSSTNSHLLPPFPRPQWHSECVAVVSLIPHIHLHDFPDTLPSSSFILLAIPFQLIYKLINLLFLTILRHCMRNYSRIDVGHS